MLAKPLFTLLWLLLISAVPSEVKAQKSAPVAVDDTYDVGYNVPRSISVVNGLLANDTDANGSATIAVQTLPVNAPSNGSVVLGADGSFSYSPNTGFLGIDTFTYRVCDDGTPNDIVSRFNFNDPDLTIAAIGPDAKKRQCCCPDPV